MSKKSWTDVFIKPAEADGGNAPPSTVVPRRFDTPAPVRSSRPPINLSTLVPGNAESIPLEVVPTLHTTTPAPVPEGPTQRALDLAKAFREHVPADNPRVRLMETMTALEDALADPKARRDAALKVLSKQGVTSAAIDAGSREVEQTIGNCVETLLKQTKASETQNVTGKRTEAQTLRSEIDKVKDEITACNTRIADLTQQAAAADAAADAIAKDLDSFNDDLQEAQTVARQMFGL